MTNFIPVCKPETPDHLFHIPALFCPKCDEWRDFYLHEGAAFCECCHEQLTVTHEDIDSVAGRSPRAGIKRVSGLIGGTDLEKSHNAHFKNNVA